MTQFAWATSLASRLIKKNGVQIQLVTIANGVVTDPTKPWRPSPAVPGTPVNCWGVFSDMNEAWLRFARDFREGLSDGTQDFRAGDINCLLAIDNIVTDPVANQDRIVRWDGEWSILNVRNPSPNGERIYFDLHLRR